MTLLAHIHLADFKLTRHILIETVFPFSILLNIAGFFCFVDENPSPQTGLFVLPAVALPLELLVPKTGPHKKIGPLVLEEGKQHL